MRASVRVKRHSPAYLAAAITRTVRGISRPLTNWPNSAGELTLTRCDVWSIGFRFCSTLGANESHCHGNRYRGIIGACNCHGITPDICAFCHPVIRPDYSDNSNGDLRPDTGNDVTVTPRGEMYGGANTPRNSLFLIYFVRENSRVGKTRPSDTLHEPLAADFSP